MKHKILSGEAFRVSNPKGESFIYRLRSDGIIGSLGALSVVDEGRRVPRIVATIDVREKGRIYPAASLASRNAPKRDCLSRDVAVWALRLILRNKKPPQGYKIEVTEKYRAAA